MDLPEDVLAIIKAYCQPVTRPGWRKLRKMSSYTFHQSILKKYNSRSKSQVIYNFVSEYSRHPQDIYIYSFDHPYIDWNLQTIIVSLMKK